MSLNFKPLEVVSVIDPRTAVFPRKWAILKSGKTITDLPVTTTNISSTSLTFNIKPPSSKTFVNKYIILRLPIRITLNSAGNGNNLLRAGFDAPRQFPIASATENINLSLNGTTVSTNISDYIHALMHYNADEMIKHREYSLTPSYADQSQEYNDLIGSVRNPLGLYNDGYGDMTGGRGSFEFNIVSNTPTQAVIDFVATEAIFMSPCFFGDLQKNLGGTGLIGLNNIDITYSFVANAWARMWSHNALGPLAPAPIASGSVQFNNFAPAFSYGANVPALLVEYISPSDLELIPESVDYNYKRITRYPNDFGNLAANSVETLISSQNITFHSIPEKIYIFVRNNNATLQSNATYTDTFAKISKVAIQWNNVSGVLSQASEYQLYNMSVQNGLNMSWQAFSGGPLNDPSFNKYGTVGAILCFRPDINFGLSPTESVGLVGNYQFQIDVTCRNVNQTNAMNASLYIVACEAGCVSLQHGGGLANIGVVTAKDILDSKSHMANTVSYEDIIEASHGGNFLETLKSFGHKVWEGIKKIAPYIKQGIDIASTVAKVAPLIGLGEDQEMSGYGAPVGGRRKAKRRRGGELVGDAMVGGEMMDRMTLRDRLM